MKYFTKEELEDITNKLIENPTRETLRNLNDTYNGKSDLEQKLVSNDSLSTTVPPVVDSLPNVSAPIQNEVVNEVLPSGDMNPQVIAPIPTISEQPVVETIPNFNIPSIELPQVDTMTNNNMINNMQMSNLELPKLETPVFNNQNNEPINFSGNLWETPAQNMGNLMQTTDNFNSMPNGIPNTEVSVSPAPFFGVSNEPVNNPIPVEGPINNMPVMGPSMFGEMQQNYM